MSHVQKVIKAIKLKLKLNRLSKAKENAMREFLGLPPRTTWFEECTGNIMTCVKDKFCQIFCPCCIYDRLRFKKRLTCWDSPIFKEFIGFLGGVILTILVYFILVYQMDAHPRLAFIICSVASCLLTTVMAFSESARCLVLLMLPQFFSGKGRMLLLLYALFLAINHPLMNLNKNIAVMSQSTTCGQEMALNDTMELVKAATAPLESIMNSIEGVIMKLLELSNRFREMYLALERGVAHIGATVKAALNWVKEMVEKCNQKMGQPYHRCRHAFQRAEDKCKDKFFLKVICKIAGLIGNICHVVRVAELFCKLVEILQELIRSKIVEPTVAAIQSAKEMYYFSVTLDYNFNYTLHQSKSYSDIRKDINKEIHNTIDTFINFVDITKNFMIFGILFIVIKALYYRSKYLTDDRYDNIYITFTVRDLDERMKEKGRPGIFPLKFDEECKYVSSLSAIMIWKEKKKLAFGLVIFILSFFNAAFYLFCDFGLYSVLHLINKHYGIASKTPVSPYTKLHVAGEGPMADMYRSLVSMFDHLEGADMHVDVTSCVPVPSEPDWGTYKLIGFIYFVCLILTIAEAYGLRLRHIIMACYYPKRERLRALWLFNHILKTRGGIMDAAKDKIRKKNSGDLDVDHISLKGRLAASFPFFEKLFKFLGWEVKSCLYCGREGKPDDYFNFVHCAYYDCNAVFCIECYTDLDNVCPACLKKVQIDEIAASEEVDSSLDERDKLLSEAQKLAKEDRIEDLKAEKRPSKRLAEIRRQMNMPMKPASSSSESSSSQGSSSDSSKNTNTNRYWGHGYSNNATDNTETQEDCFVDITMGESDENGRYESSSLLKKGTSQYSGAQYLMNQRKGGYGLNRSGNARLFQVCTESSDDESSSDCSSVCTDDLDFSYQYVKDLDGADDGEGYNCNLKRKSKGLDLAKESIYSDTESENETTSGRHLHMTEKSDLKEPSRNFIFRQ